MPAAAFTSPEQKQRLRRLLVAMAGTDIRTKGQRYSLIALIKERTGEVLSETNLRRILGQSDHDLSRTTQEILARALGYANWAGFAGDSPPPDYSYQPDPLAAARSAGSRRANFSRAALAGAVVGTAWYSC